MRVAILGATSLIARDLITSFSIADDKHKHLHLFARHPNEVVNWLTIAGLAGRYPVNEFSEFANHKFDAIINFIGVGNPGRVVAMGQSIFDITLRFDEMVLDYLRTHSMCRYVFLSSGAAYGQVFNEPVTCGTPAIVAINNLKLHDWYGTAKLHVECRHRSCPELSIIDIRVFNYVTRTQDLSAGFLITDILRSVRDKSVLNISSENIVRDYLHPSDFHQLVDLLLSVPATNGAVDCYSRAPIDKLNLLTAMQDEFGLRYETVNGCPSTKDSKPHYYSLNRRAADFGYQPSLTSLEGIMREAKAILRK